MSLKATLNQTQQIERGVLKNNSESDTTNTERCPQVQLNQTLQIERGVLKTNAESDTRNREVP